MGSEAEGEARSGGQRRQAVRTFWSPIRTPMWFTILALLAGAAGTYSRAQVNARFEEQKIKTDFVVRNYN
jgi:hypothetical protein